MRDEKHQELLSTLTLGTFHPLPSLAMGEGYVRSREEEDFPRPTLRQLDYGVRLFQWEGVWLGFGLFFFFFNKFNFLSRQSNVVTGKLCSLWMREVNKL